MRAVFFKAAITQVITNIGLTTNIDHSGVRFLPELQCLPFPPGLCRRWPHTPEPASAPQKSSAPKRKE